MTILTILALCLAIAISQAVTTFSVAYTATPLAALSKLVIEATPMLSAGVSYVKRSLYRVVKIGGVAGASPLDILAEYNAMFGTLVAGKKVGIRATVISSTGGRSNRQEQLITIA
jgi:hypothetical protein